MGDLRYSVPDIRKCLGIRLPEDKKTLTISRDRAGTLKRLCDNDS